MATRGLAEFRSNGVDYTFNDPNNANEFDASLNYVKGQYVYYQGDLYKFLADHSSGTTWANSSTKQVLLGDEIRAMLKNVNGIMRESKNLLILPDIAGTVGDITYSSHDNRISIVKAGTSSGQRDINFPLGEWHLPAGQYKISMHGDYDPPFQIYAYLYYKGVGYSDSYMIDNETGETGTITVSADRTVTELKLRINQSSGCDIDAYLQFEAGTVATDYESPLSAKDSYLEKIVLKNMERVGLAGKPVFENGYLDASTGAITYDSNSSRSYLVTSDLLFVRGGAKLTSISDTKYNVTVCKYTEAGAFISGEAANLSSSRVISQTDAYIRIGMRTTGYDDLIPFDPYDDIQFDILYNKSALREMSCTFIGCYEPDGSSAESQIVKLPDGRNLMIDSQLMQNYTGFSSYFRGLGVRRLDYYVQTHYHGDHTGIINVLQYLPERMDITNAVVFLPPEITEQNLANIDATERAAVLERQSMLISYLTNNNCTIIRPTEGMVYKLTEDISLLFYNCNHSAYAQAEGPYTSHNYNDWSLCCYVIYGQNRINITADLGPIAQSKVGGTLMKANIMTAPHHGWDNGVNNLIPAFINNVNPDVVISTNGHEHNPTNTSSPACVMDRSSPMQSWCEANGVSNYMTVDNGPIKVVLDKHNWRLDGAYSRYIRNGKNWKYTDNSDKVET